MFSGYLLKKIRNKNKWNKRWFILEEENLFYYKNKNSTTIKNKIEVINILDIFERNEKENVFTILTAERSYDLKALDSETKGKWINILKYVFIKKERNDPFQEQKKENYLCMDLHLNSETWLCDIHPEIKRGYLFQRQNQESKSWDKNICILNKDFIIFFNPKQPSSYIETSSFLGAHKTSSTEEYKNCFLLITENGIEVFCALSSEDSTEWIDVLNQLCPEQTQEKT